MAHIVGVDYGTKHIGLAVGDTDVGIASPLETIDPRSNIMDQVHSVLSAVLDYGVSAFVVGLPLNMDGTEGEQARITRNFGDALANTSGRPVHYWDERLSSQAAQGLLRPAELSRKKRKALENSVAAQVILQSYLDHQGDAERAT
jgi:putative Holliday junction resolvase